MSAHTQKFIIDRVMNTHSGFGPISFDTEIQFGVGGSVTETHPTFVHGISGLAVEGGGDVSAKLLFNVGDYGAFGNNTTKLGTSAMHDGKLYEFYLNAGWHGASFALIDSNRNSTFFCFNSGHGHAAFIAKVQSVSGHHPGHGGHHPDHRNNAVSPRLRRLWELGYV